MALQRCPCIPECRTPTSPAGIPTPHPPEGISEGWMEDHRGCHSVRARHKTVPQWDNKGSVVMGDMMALCCLCRHEVCACEALAVAASVERWMRARGRSSDALDKELLTWSAQAVTPPSLPVPLMTCCTHGGHRAYWVDESSGILREQRCGWWLAVVWQSWTAVCH